MNTFVIKLLELDIKNQSAFLADINENHTGDDKYISSNISKLDIEILKSWKLLQDARPGLQYRKDWAVLQEAKSILTNASLLTELGEVEGLKTIIEKNYTAPCNVCSSNNTKLIFLNDYLNYGVYFATNYNETKTPGYNIVRGKSGMLSAGIHQVIATAFILRVLKENSSNLAISSFEEKIETVNDSGEENKAFADIIENNNKIIECKSWEINGIAFQNFIKEDTELRGSTKQFATYLSDASKVTSMDKIEYWFDKMKLGNSTDPTQVKEKFKQMMYNGTTLTKKGELIFEAIWGNSALRGSLFGDIQPQDLVIQKTKKQSLFSNWISKTAYKFYDFIEIK